MPHYFFQVCNGQGMTSDEEGIDLQDEAAARSMAMDSIRSIVAEEARKGVIDLDGYIEIENAECEVLTRIAFPEAFALRLSGSAGER